LQNQGQNDHPFRSKTDTHSGAKRTLKTHHQNCDFKVYEGFKTLGKDEIVLLKGIPIIVNNIITTKQQPES